VKPKSYKGPEIEVLVRSLSSSNDEAISKIIGYISEGNSKCREKKSRIKSRNFGKSNRRLFRKRSQRKIRT